MGALSAKCDDGGQNEDGELTFLGRVLAQLPVNLYLGKMIVLGHVFGCLDECLIIGNWVNKPSITACAECVACVCLTICYIFSCLTLIEELFCHTIHASACWP